MSNNHWFLFHSFSLFDIHPSTLLQGKDWRGSITSQMKPRGKISTYYFIFYEIELAENTKWKILNKVWEPFYRSSSNSGLFAKVKKEKYRVKNEVNKGKGDFGGNKKCRSNWTGTVRGLLSQRRKEGRIRGNGRVVNSTIRLGQILSSDDENSDEKRDDSCKSSTYLPNSFSDYVGGFGYPTGYCLK